MNFIIYLMFVTGFISVVTACVYVIMQANAKIQKDKAMADAIERCSGLVNPEELKAYMSKYMALLDRSITCMDKCVESITMITDTMKAEYSKRSEEEFELKIGDED